MSDHLTDEAVDGSQSDAPADDLRSTIASALESQKSSADSPDAASDKAEAPKEPADAPDKASAERTASERSRDEQGRFARAAEQQKAAEPDKAPTQQQPAADKAEPEVEFAKVAARWSTQDREMLGKLEPAARDFLVRRHNEMVADHTRKTMEIAAAKREYEPIDAMFAPHQDKMRQMGVTKASIIKAWHDVESTLVGGGAPAVNAVANIIQGYKIDRAAVARALGVMPPAGGPGAPQPVPQPDGAARPTDIPVHPAVIQALQEMKQNLDRQELERRQMRDAEYASQASRVQSEIDQFATAVDSGGALLHPYFHEVEADMERLAKVAAASGKVPVLSELYEQAVWSNPSTRVSLQEAARLADQAQREATERRQREEARAKAEKARRAGSSVTGAPGSGQSGRPSGEMSLRQQLEEAVRDTRAA